MAPHGKLILGEAQQLGMTSAGWAWLVADGITTMVRFHNGQIQFVY